MLYTIPYTTLKANNSLRFAIFNPRGKEDSQKLHEPHKKIQGTLLNFDKWYSKVQVSHDGALLKFFCLPAKSWHRKIPPDCEEPINSELFKDSKKVHKHQV